MPVDQKAAERNPNDLRERNSLGKKYRDKTVQVK